MHEFFLFINHYWCLVLDLTVLLILTVLLFVLVKKRIDKSKMTDADLMTQNENVNTADWYIFYASQRGRATRLANQTEQALTMAGFRVELIKLSTIKPQDLAGKKNCLFITSTFGNGQAPESARGFERKLNKTQLNLSSLSFAVLALGDKQYDRFCGFGRKLDKWLTNQQAQSLKPITTVSQMNAEAIDSWIAFIGDLGGDSKAFIE